MLIIYEISKLSNVLIMSESKNKWYSIIIFVLQFISLMFFLEIFEFNFCGLNRNTKKSIEEREEKTMIMKESVESLSKGMDIGGYIIKDENNPVSREMSEISIEEKIFKE